jgi:hypothetical protein
VCCLCISSFLSNAQVDVSEDLFEKLLQTNLSETDAVNVDESLMPDIEFLRKHPLDLNSASVDEMTRTGLFSFHQATAIRNHIRVYGRLFAIEELQVSGVFTNEEILAMKPYIRVSDPHALSRHTFGDVLKAGNSEIFLRSYSVLERSKGYKSDVPAYHGMSPSSMIRFRYNSRNRLMAGFILENDPGEMNIDKQRIADFFSWHLFMRSDGLIRRVVIGDFLVGYGQGLTYAGSGRSGLSFDAGSVIRPQSGIRPYRSVTESGFLRGVATSLRKGKAGLDLFYSNVREDATIRYDSLGRPVFTSLSTSGLHRTDSELKKKSSLAVRSAGSHLSLNIGKWDLGVTMVRIRYSKLKERGADTYALFDHSGQETYRTGFSFSGRIRNVHLFGEITDGNLNDLPFLAGTMVQLHSGILWTTLVRSYPAGRDVVMSDPVARSGGSNERGIYNGLNFHFSRTFNVNLFYDFYRRPWTSYADDLPGHGHTGGVRVVLKPDRHREFLVQCRFRGYTENQIVDAEKFRQQQLRDQASMRVQYKVTTKTRVTLRTRLEFNRIKKGVVRSSGFMIYQDLIYKPLMSRYSINLRFAVFDTDDYSSRIYAFENNVLYAYSIPSYYYNGYRYYLLLSYKLHERLSAWARFSRTIYLDRDQVGSGNDLIEGNRKSVLDVQLRYSF